MPAEFCEIYLAAMVTPGDRPSSGAKLLRAADSTGPSGDQK
jgi:hypothetical protein